MAVGWRIMSARTVANAALKSDEAKKMRDPIMGARGLHYQKCVDDHPSARPGPVCEWGVRRVMGGDLARGCPPRKW